MKHLFTFSLLLFSVFIFAKETVSISGKINNLEGNELFVNGFNFNLSIPVNPDGSFAKEFEIEHPGIYTFYADKNNFSVYLAKDIQLVLEADAANFLTTAKLSGKNIEENNYLLEKAKLYAPTLNTQKFYSLKEEAFVKTADSIFAANQSLLKRSNLKPDFSRLEEKYIIHGVQPFFNYYRVYYSMYTKSSLPKAKLVEAKVIKISNIEISEEEFFFSSTFRGLQNSKFNAAFTPKFEKNPSLCKSYIEEAFANIPNLQIQEFLLKNSARDIKSNKEKDKFLFEAITTLSKDEKFKGELREKMESIGSFVNGSPAPNFELLDNNDKKVTLEDFKGKYVYIDFWATWCKPCIGEIPSLKKMEEKFKDKNIVFLSISVDNQKDTAKWKKFIIDKELHGPQLIGDNGWESKISKEYTLQSIPRFVLIDTEGFLVDINAPRPSDSKLAKMLNKLDKI